MSVWALTAITLGAVGAGAVLLGIFGMGEGAAWFGLAVLVCAAAAVVEIRVESRVERVVRREVSALLEREIAAYHMGRSQRSERSE